MKEKEIVPNDVYRFRICLVEFIETIVPVKKGAFNKNEEDVQKAYFTKEKIKELKELFIQKINNIENPFDISCVDQDSEYSYDEKELFPFKE